MTKKIKNKKLQNNHEDEKSIELEEQLSQFLLLDPSAGQPEEPKIRLLSLYGEIDEERASDITYSLMVLKEMGKREEIKTIKKKEVVVTTYEPIDLIISTHGGAGAEMFALYDTMRIIRKDCDINTLALGKVMSAGVLLLAAGTKGKRKITKNCRVMIHSVVAGSHGALHNLENEMDEIRHIQERHMECLVDETKMTKRQLTKLMDKKINVYLTAEQAVKYGIADEIV